MTAHFSPLRPVSLHVGADECHIGAMDEEQVNRVIAVLDEQRPTSATVRQWAKARKAVTA